MYRITRTIFILRNGERTISNEVVDVPDLEEYRKTIKQPRHAKINFVYQTISDDEYNGKNQAD